MLKVLSAMGLAGMIGFAAAITPANTAPLQQKGVQETVKIDEVSAQRRYHRRYHRRYVRRSYRPYGYYGGYPSYGYGYRPYYYPYYRPYAYAPAPFVGFGFGFGGPRYWW